MTPENKEASKQANWKLTFSIQYLSSCLSTLSTFVESRNSEDSDVKAEGVSVAAAEAIRATHAVCDRIAELAAIHRR